MGSGFFTILLFWHQADGHFLSPTSSKIYLASQLLAEAKQNKIKKFQKIEKGVGGKDERVVV